MKKLISGVYIIKNLVNDKIYVGSSVDMKRRFTVHRWLLNNQQHHNEHLQRSWNKYGADAFIFDMLIICEKDKIRDMEQFFINKYDCCNKLHGYNIDPYVDPSNRHYPEWAKKFRETIMKNKTHCVHGHEFNEENTRWIHGGRHRKCIACTKQRKRKQFQAMKILTLEERLAIKDRLIQEQKACPKSHPYKEKTLLVDKKGRPICSECRKLQYINRKAKKSNGFN